MAEDVLHWLVPEANPEERVRLRRFVTALRLLRDDARAGARPLVSPWARAVAELEAAQRRLRRRAIDGVLHATLASLRSPESFLELGPSPMAYGPAWRTLLDLADARCSALPPAPGEATASVVDRLLAAGQANGAPLAWRSYWEACHRHLTGEPARAERRWSELFAHADEAGAPPPFLARLLAGRVAARLEFARPWKAWELYARHAPLVASDPGLRRLLGWSALLCGERLHARDLLAPLPAGRLPRALLELREDLPEWASLLRLDSAGTDRSWRPMARGRGVTPASVPTRQRLGAECLAVFRRAPDGSVRMLDLDAPAELRRALRERFSCRVRPEDEPRLSCRRRAIDGGDLPEALAGPGILALARHVWTDSGGAVSGWVQVECRHHLLPSSSALDGLIRAPRAQDLLDLGNEARVATTRGGGGSLRREAFAAEDPRAELLACLLGELFRAARAGEDAPPGAWRVAWVERAGDGFLLRAERGAGGLRLAEGLRALRDAWANRAAVSHSVRRGHATGGGEGERRILPLVDRIRRRVLGLLVLEGPAGSLALEGLRRRASERLGELEAQWQAARFRAAHREREGLELAWDPAWRHLASLEPTLGDLLAAPGIPLVVGAPGSGRRTLARWLHFRGPWSEEAPVEGVEAERRDGARLVALESLDRPAQARLAREGDEPGRVFLFAREPAEALRACGRLTPELARRLAPRALVVPELRSRRDEIPRLSQLFVRRAAREESLAPVRLADDALAFLWRQDWPGHVVELEAFARALVRARPGTELDAEAVRGLLRSRGLAPRERLPSLRPRALDLELALETTRHRSGAENRARAARYLGWHPATLAARLRGGVSETAEGSGPTVP